MERVAPAVPAPTPSPDQVNRAVVLRGRLPEALFDVDHHLMREDFDALKYLPRDRVPALVRDAITLANQKGLTPGREAFPIEFLGNIIIDLISSLPATDCVPIAELVAEQLRAQRPALDDKQPAWLIAKCDAQHLIAELVGFVKSDHTVDERKRVLRLLGAAADCQNGRAGSPARGAGPSGGDFTGPGELLDDVASGEPDNRLVSSLFATTRQKGYNKEVLLLPTLLSESARQKVGRGDELPRGAHIRLRMGYA
jgi:hypothetical protein